MSASNLARDIVFGADLSPTEHLILEHFLEKATDPETAAHHLLSQTTFTESRERTLVSQISAFDSISDDTRDRVFERDGEGFAMRMYPSHVPDSDVKPAYVIPPSTFQGLESAENVHLFALIEAFISTAGVERLRCLLQAKENRPSLDNVLLLPPTIHKAFRAGHVVIKNQFDPRTGGSAPGCIDGYYEKYMMTRQYPEAVHGLYLGGGTKFMSTVHFWHMSTSNPDCFPLPSKFLLNLHLKFAEGLHLPVTRRLKTLWLCLPQRLRILCYTLLGTMGRKLYPLEAELWAQRLPFGLYVKECTRAPANEPHTLKLIENCTSIPAPRLIDAWEHNGRHQILMTRVPGARVGDICHLMSYTEREQFAEDVRACVEQLRKIPNTTPYLICDSLGGQIRDHRVPNDGLGGPLKTEDDFNDFLTSHLGAPFSGFAELEKLTVRKHEHFYFTHSDLHPSNLLVVNGRLSGIEFTKAMYGSSMAAPGVMTSIWWRTFGRQYEAELAVEQKLWYRTPFGC
ncbi:kinase-like protein [Aspergillus karnatakaensis]|uniref:kinase-like protein n=1 Tax=Aspergillus karnatakaensis TaxID=1810916 RepID=UPI003CCE08D7